MTKHDQQLCPPPNPDPHPPKVEAPRGWARSGLTGAMKALALEIARFNVTINNLLPERFDTDRQHQMAKAAMTRENISYEEARAPAGGINRGQAFG